MPGSLLNLGRNRVSRHDSTRSDVSTYSNDSKKRVSFNKAVRVKKYTRSEDGSDSRHGRRKFWFKVYDDLDSDPDRWEEYSGDEGNKLKTIDESSSIHAVDADSNGDVKKIIEKFNEQSLRREKEPSSDYDTLTKYKKNSILNGMKSLFGSASFRNKKRNNVQDRNLENLFRNYDEADLPNGDVKANKSSDELWSPKGSDKLYKSELDDGKLNAREGMSSVKVEKWDSGDQLVFDTRQFDKSVNKTDDGELTKTVEQEDKVWKNVTQTITYAESSPKIIRKTKERTNHHKGSRSDVAKTVADRTRSPIKNKRDIATQCTQVPEPKTKNSDKYKVIRSRNGVVSAFSNVPLLEEDKAKTTKRTVLDMDRMTRPTTCKRDHQRKEEGKRENAAPSVKYGDSKHAENVNTKKDTFSYSPTISREASHRKTEPKLGAKSSADYRRGYSTLSTYRRGSRNRARSHDDRIPNVSGVKILVNGESIEEGAVRGGLAAAYKNRRQRARNSSTSPVREFQPYSPVSEGDPAYNHETVVLYIPGISHQEKRAEEEERISGGTLTRSQSMLTKRPPKNSKHGSVRNGPLLKELDQDDELITLIEDKEVSPKNRRNQRWTEYRTLARV